MATDLKLADKSTEDPENDFELLEKLGEGSFGVVWKARHKRSQSIVAIKVVEADDADDVLKEIQILKTAISPKIVRYYGSYVKEKDNEFFVWRVASVFAHASQIVMEYCGGGSVSDLLSVCKRGLNEDQIALIVRDTLEALQHLHAKNMIHRDLKAGNILLTNDGEGKLADFGVSGQLTGTLAKRKTMVGSPFWMAPEVIMENGHDCKADVWSLGITIIEMAERQPPLYNTHPMRAIFMIPSRSPPTFTTPGNYSKELNDFLARCLTKKPSERATVAELLKHDFITKRAKGVSPKCLVDVVAEVASLIEKTGSRAKAVGFEPSVDELPPAARKSISKKAGATLRRTQGPKTKGATRRPDLGTMFDNTDSDSGTMVSKDSPSGTMMVKDSPSGTMMVKDSGTMMVKDSGTMMVKDSGTMMVKDSPTGTMVRKDNGTMVNKSDSPSGTVVLHGNATFTGGALAAAAAAMRPSAGVGQSVAPSAPNPEFAKFSDAALQKKIEELQSKMENEIKEIEERYGNLKKPFVSALSERRATSVTPGSPQTKPGLPLRSPKK